MTYTQTRPRVGPLARVALAIAAAVGVAAGGAACSQQEKPKPPRYATKEKKSVPPYFKDSVIEMVDIIDTAPFVVSGYGLVVGLPDTGGGPYPTAVREYMLNDMYKHGFGRPSMTGFEGYRPELLLDSRSTAVVEVVGLLPPGIRKGQPFDAVLQALPDSDTTSVARGRLYRTDLKFLGTNPLNPGGAVNVFAQAYGDVFNNPAYVAASGAAGAAARGGGGRNLSLRTGVIMDGGLSNVDRPVRLQLRQPSRATARLIEQRIDQRFQEIADVPRQDRLGAYSIAAARDEGIVEVYVPKAYNGDWQHFIAVATHLFRNGSAEFAAAKAKELADEAVKPGAPLLDITYTWEALGKPALPFVAPLMTHANPEVAFAATRASAFLGDPTAPATLAAIARAPGGAFAVPAVQVLGKLPSTPGVNRLLRDLLHTENPLVRIGAYQVLARHRDPSIFTTPVGEKFALDIVDSDGPPLIFATRRGVARIAIIGPKVRLDMPLTFTALDGAFSISSDERAKFVNLFSRQASDGKSLVVLSNPDAAEVVARLGGVGPVAQERRFNFAYGDVVGILQALADRKLLLATDRSGRTVASAFVLQDAPGVEDTINSAPAIPAAGRPQADAEPSKDAKGPSADAGELR